jgi:hypothetical protein
MAYTLDQLTALQDAIAQGVLEVKHADKTVTYRSLNEMNRICGIIEQALGRGSSSRRYALFNKGLGSNQNANTPQ